MAVTSLVTSKQFMLIQALESSLAFQIHEEKAGQEDSEETEIEAEKGVPHAPLN